LDFSVLVERNYDEAGRIFKLKTETMLIMD